MQYHKFSNKVEQLAAATRPFSFLWDTEYSREIAALIALEMLTITASIAIVMAFQAHATRTEVISMSAAELKKFVGKNGRYVCGNKGQLSFAVKIIDARSQFGRIDLLIKPRNGDGEEWVSLQNVTLDSEEKP